MSDARGVPKKWTLMETTSGKRIRIQRHAVETNSYVCTRLRLEEFPVKTWRTSLSLSSEGDDGSVLAFLPVLL